MCQVIRGDASSGTAKVKGAIATRATPALLISNCQRERTMIRMLIAITAALFASSLLSRMVCLLCSLLTWVEQAISAEPVMGPRGMIAPLDRVLTSADLDLSNQR